MRPPLVVQHVLTLFRFHDDPDKASVTGPMVNDTSSQSSQRVSNSAHLSIVWVFHGCAYWNAIPAYES